jgi:CRISPR-associated protein Csb2
MIALGIRYLCGYAAATDLARQKPEWPVHPGRVFLAMAAAHYETGAYPAERAALEWLESAEPPAIRAGSGEARSNVRAYVPVNDENGNIVQRLRQERAFPKVWLEDDSVYLVWNSDPPENVRGALVQLCPKVTRIGHSSSLAQMWVVAQGEEPEPNWILSNDGRERFRVASGGTMAALDAAFNAEGFLRFEEMNSKLSTATGRAKVAVKGQIAVEFPNGRPEHRRPELAGWQGYKESRTAKGTTPVEGPFDSNILVLAKFEGRNLGLDATLSLTKALRNAALKAATESQRPAPEWLSGHQPDGSPSSKPHVSFFPLAFTGSEHADGHVMGLGVALPREIASETDETREETLRRVLGPLFFDLSRGVERKIRLWSNRPETYPPELVWEWKIERESRESPPATLRPETWTEPSRTWASVTPVVLHHYPKKSRPGDVELIVREAFLSALMPEPEEVLIRSVSALGGAGHARAMPAFDDGGVGLCRYQTHVLARFANPVRGPVLVGRGRYRGYGLFKPVAESRDRGDGN